MLKMKKNILKYRCTHDNLCLSSGFMCGSRGGIGGPDTPPPPEKSQNIGFFAVLVRIPGWKIIKLPIQHSMLGHHRHASEAPFKWRFAGGPMVARLQWYFDPPSPHQLKKTLSQLDPPLTKSSGSAHGLHTLER